MSVKIYINSESLKTILAKKNVRLSVFADNVGVSRSTVSMWLSHKKSPNPESRKKIQTYLGKTRKWDAIFITAIFTNTAKEVRSE